MGAREALCFLLFFASPLRNRPGWWCIIHGASYAELERAVGPEGSAGDRVSGFAFCSWRARHVIERKWREIITYLALYTLPCFCVSGTAYCNTPVSSCCSGFLIHQRHKTNCSAQNAEFVECIFLSSSVHNIYVYMYTYTVCKKPKKPKKHWIFLIRDHSDTKLTSVTPLDIIQ